MEKLCIQISSRKAEIIVLRIHVLHAQRLLAAQLAVALSMMSVRQTQNAVAAVRRLLDAKVPQSELDIETSNTYIFSICVLSKNEVLCDLIFHNFSVGGKSKTNNICLTDEPTADVKSPKF